MAKTTSLDELRKDIDAIDDKIHDLLMQRATLVDAIRQGKKDRGGPIIQPVREAGILSRLAQRHTGRLPFPVIVRIWREIIAIMTLLQQPVAVAVFAPDGAPGAWDLARDHFGSQMPMQALQTTGQVLRAVAERDAVLGVLPLPYEDDPDPWWPYLTVRDGTAPHIIERLSANHGGAPGAHNLTNARGSDRDVLVIAKQPMGPAALARAYYAFEIPTEISRTRLFGALGTAGLDCNWLVSHNKGGFALAMAAFTGPVAPNDARLTAFMSAIGMPVDRIYAIGGHPDPVTFTPGPVS